MLNKQVKQGKKQKISMFLNQNRKQAELLQQHPSPPDKQQTTRPRHRNTKLFHTLYTKPKSLSYLDTSYHATAALTQPCPLPVLPAGER